MLRLTSLGALNVGAAGTDGSVVLYSEQGTTDYSVTFQPNAAMTQVVTYTLPADDGGASQLLQTDGAGVLSWVTPTGEASPWTDDGAVVRLDDGSDSVTIGSTINRGKLTVEGDADEVQLRVLGNATQSSNNLIVFENSSGTDLFTLSGAGSAIFQTATDAVTGFQVMDADGGDPVFNIDTINEFLGVNTSAPDRAVEINHASGQNLRLTYNDTDGSAVNYTDLTTGTDGSLTIAPKGSGHLAVNSIPAAGASGSAVTIAPTFNAMDEAGDAINGLGVVVDAGSPTNGTVRGLYLPNATNQGTSLSFAVDIATGWDAGIRSSSPVVFGAATPSAFLHVANPASDNQPAVLVTNANTTNDPSGVTITMSETGGPPLILSPLSAAPTTSSEGSLYYDSDDDTLYVYTGAGWTSAMAGEASPWTDDGAVVRLDDGTDSVSIGSTANLAKLGVVGDADEIQLLVKGTVSQGENIVEFEDSAGTDLFALKSTGGATFRMAADTGDAYQFLEADSGNVVLAIDTLNERIGIRDSTPDAVLDIEPTGAVTTTAAATGLAVNNLTTNATTDGINKYGLYATSTGTFTGGGGAGTRNYGLYVDTVSGADENYGAFISDWTGIGAGAARPASPLEIAHDSSITGAVVDLVTLTRTSSGTPGTGIGAGISFAIEDLGSGANEHATLEVELSDVTDSSEDANFLFFVDSGGSRTGVMQILGDSKSVALGSDRAAVPGTLKFYDGDASSPETVTITVPNLADGTSYTLTLPPDDGDAGEQLQTDGAGTLTWEAAGGTPTAWDDIADPDANTTINLAGFTTVLDSTLDGGSVLKIDNSAANISVETVLLELEFTDQDDGDAKYLQMKDNNGSVKLEIEQDSLTTIAMAIGGSSAGAMVGIIDNFQSTTTPMFRVANSAADVTGSILSQLEFVDQDDADAVWLRALDNTSDVQFIMKQDATDTIRVGIGATAPGSMLEVRNDNSTADAVVDLFTLTKDTTGTAAAGIGAGFSFHIEDAGGSEEQGSIDVSMTTVTDASEDADMIFSLNRAGTITEVMRLDGSEKAATFAGQYGGAINTIANCSGGSASVDWNNGNTQHLSVSEACTLSFSNGLSGRKYTLILKYSGAYGITWPGTVRWSGATAPTLTSASGKTDYIGFIYNSVDSTYDGVSERLNF
ncbi:MAG TPA: hypothetical protein VGB20_00285 [bacterium]